MNLIKQNNEYVQWVEKLKNLIQKSQIKASISVNKELLKLYWNMGNQSLKNQKRKNGEHQ